MRGMATVAALLLAACGGDATGPDPAAEPGEVVVVSGSQVEIFQGARVTLALRNEGGPGVFVVDFYSDPRNVVNGSRILRGSSEPVQVAAAWSESATWDVPTDQYNSGVSVVVVRTRDPGSITYRETDRHEF